MYMKSMDAVNASSLIQNKILYTKKVWSLSAPFLYVNIGEHLKVVIVDTSIGRVPEATACADKFRKEGVDITLFVTPCWCSYILVS